MDPLQYPWWDAFSGKYHICGVTESGMEHGKLALPHHTTSSNFASHLSRILNSSLLMHRSQYSPTDNSPISSCQHEQAVTSRPTIEYPPSWWIILWLNWLFKCQSSRIKQELGTAYWDGCIMKTHKHGQHPHTKCAWRRCISRLSAIWLKSSA